MKTKKISLIVLSILASLFLTLSAVFFGGLTQKVYAGSLNVAENSDFYVKDGASARTVVGSSGIRFTTVISKDFYDDAVSKGGVWHSIIGYQVENASELNKGSINGDNIVAFNSGDVIVPTDQGDGTYTFNTCLTYNTAGKTEQELAEGFNRKINVRSYVQYNDESIVYSNTTNGDTYRSIAEVAEKVLVNDSVKNNYYDLAELSAQKDILTNYIVGSQKPIVFSDMAYLEDMYLDETKTFSCLGVANGTYQVSFNGTSFEQEITDGSFTLETLPSGLTLGQTYPITFVGNGKVYVQNYKYVSMVVNNYTELNTVTHLYNFSDNETGAFTKKDGDFYDRTTYSQRYFVLGNDVALFNYEVFNDAELQKYRGIAVDYGFVDIFDGQGYTISGGDNSLGYTGIFGNLGNNNGSSGVKATIKNVKITLTKLSEHAWGEKPLNSVGMNVIGRNIGRYSVLDNVAIIIDEIYDKKNKNNLDICILAHKVYDYIAFNNVYLYCKDAEYENGIGGASGSKGFQTGYISGFLSKDKGAPNITNFVAITKMTVAAHSNSWQKSNFYANGETGEGRDILTGVTHYDTIANKPANLTSVGSWTIANDGSATWNGTAQTVSTSGDFVDVFNKIEKITTGYVEDMYSAQDKTLSNVDVADGTYSATINGESVGEVTVADGVATIAVANFNCNLAFGSTYTLELTSGDDVYVQKVKYVSKVIKNYEDFYNHCVNFYKVVSGLPTEAVSGGNGFYNGTEFEKRYYVLGNNITVTTCQQQRKANATAFYDILDGQGYTIDVGDNLPFKGLFINLGVRSIIKNINVKINNFSAATAGDQWCNQDDIRNINALASTIYWNVTIENVSISINSISARSGASSITDGYDVCLVANTISENVTMKNVFIYCPQQFKVQNTCGYLASSIDSNFKAENVVAITDLDYASKNASTTNIAENDGSENTIAGVKHYDTIANKPAELTSVGSWAIANDGAVTFAGEDLSVGFDSLTLAVSESKEIEVFNTTKQFNGYIKVVADNNNVVEIDGTTITAKASGKTNVTVGYQIAGEIFTRTFTLTVA